MLSTKIWAALPLVLAFYPSTTTQLTAQQSVTQIQRHGITWTFAQPVEAGQFVNGDWWVRGPASVSSVAPAQSGSRNGSMCNPRAGSAGRQHGQGYDNRVAYYDPTRAVQFPYALQPGDSLVSTESRVGGRQPGPFRDVESQAFLAGAAVLTCVANPVAPGTFRPSYCGPKVFRTLADIHPERLPALPRVDTSPSAQRPSDFTPMFERLWLDHLNGWEGRGMHPFRNMPDYGREIALAVGEAGLLLLQDFPGQERADLLVRYLQLGTDLYGLVQDGQIWWGDGGHLQGRKWPIMFAGLMFDDAGMMQPGNGFSEDAQTYSANGWTGARALFRMRGSDTHEQRHPSAWTSTDQGYANYRRCCTGFSWVGSALCAWILGMTDEWNHEPFFHYVDRWMTPMQTGDRAAALAAIGNAVQWFPHGHTNSTLVRTMWDTYRNQYQVTGGVQMFGSASSQGIRVGVFEQPQRGQSFDIHIWNAPTGQGFAMIGAPTPIPTNLLNGDFYVGGPGIVVVALPAPNHGKIVVPIAVSQGGTIGVPVGMQFVWPTSGGFEHSWGSSFNL